MQHSRYRMLSVIGQYHGRSHRGQGVTLSQCGCHHRVAHGHITGCRQVNVVPDADVTTAYSRNPVPADGGVEGGVVCPEDAAVEVSVLFGLDLHASGIGIGDNEHLQFIVKFLEEGRDVKFAAFECPLDAAQVGAVKRHIGFPVDAVKIEEHALALHLLGQVKGAFIDKIPVEERLRSQHQVIVMVHVGQSTRVDITRQHCRGDSRNKWFCVGM